MGRRSQTAEGNISMNMFSLLSREGLIIEQLVSLTAASVVPPLPYSCPPIELR